MSPLSKLENPTKVNQHSTTQPKFVTTGKPSFIGHSGHEQIVNLRKSVNAEEIQEWLISRISEELEFEPETIDIYEPFALYGINSVVAVTLAADLEDWLQVKLPATLLWDYPTIETLSQYLENSSGQSKVCVNGRR
jgi:acyl carrier protein